MDKNLFSIQSKCFRLVGLHRVDLIMSSSFIRVFHGLSILSLVISIIAESYFIIKYHEDVLASSEAFSPLSTVTITLTKLITILWSREKFYALMDRLQAMAIRTEGTNAAVLTKVNQIDQMLTSVYLASTAFVGLARCIGPIVSDIISFINESEMARELPWKSAYPFDATKTPGYEISYLNLVVATYATVLTLVSVDSLFFGICLNICAHFDFLRESFDGNNEKFIKSHQELLSLADDVNRLFKPIIFAQFMISSMLLCVLGFQLVMHHDILKRLVLAVFGLAIIVQLFYYSYGGQLVMDKSSSAADNLYQLDKDLAMVIRRAHKSCVIKAGFYEASSATFNTILSSAASLITLLQSFTE